ncbi:MAG: peptidylprolyl isomerase [Sedimenticola thiotaurini]|uniref:Periplasmic chaperone PpiD n=1 Tax=Sedimenticola thiotaurini TaxID=1543721 RepID=A0A558D140_9GAMM|nr:MAG: peptidylprolyl isomerase [Sedimenticola thiotaurini]
MLQSIRERAQGVVAWFIVVLISVPFALFGINSYLGGGSESVAAVVNGDDISQRDFENGYRDFRQNLRQRLGENYRPEMIDEAKLRQEVLQIMIRNRLLVQKSADLGLRVGDDHVKQVIASLPGFQVGGRFSQDAFERGVRLQGLTPTGFLEEIRVGLVSEQLSKAVTGSEFTTQSELDSLVRLRLQKREFEYLTVPAATFLARVEVSDEAVATYYAAHQNEYMAPERVKIQYLDLDVASIAKTLKSDDEALQAYYNQHQSQYRTAEERRASHILIPVEEGADESAVKKAEAEATAVLERVKQGEDFPALAKELSKDPGSAEEGGDLGFFEAGVMEQAFDDAVFALAVGEVSDLVRTPFGFHIIKLTEIREPSGKSFEEARAEVEQAYLKSEAERLYYEYAERLGNLAYEESDSLQPAADALGMQIKESDWINREGGEGILAAPKVVNAAFSEDVMVSGHNSEAIELNAEHILVLRVVDHEEAAIKSLDQVADLIKDQLRIQQAIELANKQGAELVSRLNKGDTLTKVATELGVTVQPPKQISRDEQTLSPELVKQLFAMGRPESGKPLYGQLALSNGDLALLALHSVTDGTMEQANELGGEAALNDALQRSRGKSYFQHLQGNLRASAEVTITAEAER